MAKKLDGWKSRFFSEGGREVIFKAVIQAIPTYAMSCFRIPSTILKEIEAMSANFCWGFTDKGNKIHWKAWSHFQNLRLRVAWVSETYLFQQGLASKANLENSGKPQFPSGPRYESSLFQAHRYYGCHHWD